MNMHKKVFSFLLALVMLATVTAAAVTAGPLDAPDYTLEQDGIRYKEQVIDMGGKQAVFYGEYNTTAADAKYEWVIHSIRDGADTTLTTVMDIARDYEAKNGRKVMLAANGDYFYATGSNVESFVSQGVVISKGSFATKHCIGFDNQGKVTIGRMTETDKRLLVVLDGERHFFSIDKINQEPGDNEIAIYTNPGTHTVQGAGKYVCAAQSTNLNQYPVYGTSRRMATGSVQNDDAFTLKSGQFAVVVKGENAQFFFDNVIYGVEVDLVEIPAGEYAGCTWVLGGYDILVKDGKIGTDFHTDNGGNSAAPRTFIGFKPDGTGFLCMVDGRQPGYSVGITVQQEAQLASQLGAVAALELDGGGSTTVIVRIDDQLILRNKPSDGQMRKVSNAILLVEKEPEEETPPVDTPPTTPATKPTTAPTEKTDPPSQPPQAKNGVILLFAAAAVLVVVIPLVIFVILKKKRR